MWGWGGGVERQEGAGSRDSFGEQMLFAALEKIMTRQMEHFKEIHTQLSRLAPLSHTHRSAAALSFPVSPEESGELLKRHTGRYRYHPGGLADSQVGGAHLASPQCKS